MKYSRTPARELLCLRGGAGVSCKRPRLGVDVPDPAGLLKWLARDRCMVTLGAGSAIDENREAFEDLVRAWIRRI